MRNCLYLQNETKSCPGWCSVSWVKLYGGITDSDELFNPADNLFDYISQNYYFAIALSDPPEFLCAYQSFLLGLLQGIGEHITMTSIRQIKTVPELDR